MLCGGAFMDTILLNAMFVGSYGEKNIDGEIINFYLDDNGIQNYFIPEYGTLPVEIQNDTIKAILMISKIDGNTFEIIGKYVPSDSRCLAYEVQSNSIEEAKTLENENITYGGVSLLDICPVATATNKQFARVTYRGGKVFLLNANTRIILSGKAEEIINHFDCRVIQLDEYKSRNWGSRNYRIFSRENDKCYKNKDHQDDSANTYNILMDIVNNSSIWTENNAKVKLDIDSLDKIRNIDFLGLNHIIDGSHVELLSSNWLAHYIEMVPENFVEFFGVSNPGETISVKREKHNIDILVEFSNYVVVIENKIKSGIVENSSGYSCQLEKYYDIVENNEDYSQKRKKYIILCPDYEKRKISNQIDDIIKTSNAQTKQALKAYEIKTYSELKKYCMKYSPLSYAKYYTDLLDFIDDNSNVCEHYKKRKLSEKRFLHNIVINL